MKAYERATGAEPLYTSEALHAVAADPQVSHRKASEELGHRPRPHEETIRDLYAWFREHGMLKG
jgi:nucleoside-diphosphate-sugar epimerase